jgi:hypothetical protein
MMQRASVLPSRAPEVPLGAGDDGAQTRHYALVPDTGFGEAVLRVMRSGPPSGGHDLVGMEMDFFILLGDLDELLGHSVEVQRTEQPECLLRALGRTAPGVSIKEAAEAVRGLWLTKLRYSHFEAHRLSSTENSALLEFVTQIAPDGFFVTGRVEVQA